MKDVLFECGNCIIVNEEGELKIICKFSDDKWYHEYILRDENSCHKLKKELEKIRHESFDEVEASDMICDILQTEEWDEYFDGVGRSYADPRTEEEILEYKNEACDKVWLMRLCDIANKKPLYEVSRPAMEQILATYPDIPENGYSDWECGYWNGILGALRWVLGEEKDFLDT